MASILPIPAQSDALLRLRAFNTESRPSPQAALSIAGRQMALWGRQEVGRLPARSYTAKRAGSGARNRAALPGARRGECGEGAAGDGGGGTGAFTQQEWGCTEPREHPDPMLEEQKAGSALTPIPLAGHPAPEATTPPPGTVARVRRSLKEIPLARPEGLGPPTPSHIRPPTPPPSPLGALGSLPTLPPTLPSSEGKQRAGHGAESRPPSPGPCLREPGGAVPGGTYLRRRRRGRAAPQRPWLYRAPCGRSTPPPPAWAPRAPFPAGPPHRYRPAGRGERGRYRRRSPRGVRPPPWISGTRRRRSAAKAAPSCCGGCWCWGCAPWDRWWSTTERWVPGTGAGGRGRCRAAGAGAEVPMSRSCCSSGSGCWARRCSSG